MPDHKKKYGAKVKRVKKNDWAHLLPRASCIQQSFCKGLLPDSSSLNC